MWAGTIVYEDHRQTDRGLRFLRAATIRKGPTMRRIWLILPLLLTFPTIPAMAQRFVGGGSTPRGITSAASASPRPGAWACTT